MLTKITGGPLNNRITYFFLLILNSFSLAIFASQCVDKRQGQKYITLVQKKDLFEKLGCRYHNGLIVPPDQRLSQILSDYEEDEISPDSPKYALNVRLKTLAPMYLQWHSDDVGYGVKTWREIPEKAFIGIYAGMLENLYKSDHYFYKWGYALSSKDEKPLAINALTVGNELRMINHSANPNCDMEFIRYQSIVYACYIANQSIPPHTELTVDYGDEYWSYNNKKPIIL